MGWSVDELLAMATKKIIAICQSGGEFETSDDGSLSYNGGEAYALDVDDLTKLSDFKKEVSETFHCSANAVSVKYFLPGNRKTLIKIAKDRDFQRMVNFYGDCDQVEVFITIEEPPPAPPAAAAPAPAPVVPTTPPNGTTVSEAVVPSDVPTHTFNADDPLYMDMAMDIQTSDALADIGGDGYLKAGSQWENIITGVDQRFRNFPEFREALRKYSVAHGFGYKYKKNDSHRVTVKCRAEGCPWRLYASRLPSTQLVCIKKMSGPHTCERAATKAGYRATRGWVGTIIKEKLKDSPGIKPKDIAEDIEREYGIKLNYTQAWRAKEMVREQMQGNFTEAYSQLPYFCDKIIETNPGSVATIETKEDTSFRRLFVSFHACITGFQQGCRPLLFLDSTPLYSKYQGTLLAAIAADAADGDFPVALAVVDVETDENWHWFLLKLKSVVSSSVPITFVANFQKGLRQSLPEIFENCHHAYCMRYLAEKLNDDVLKMQFSHDARRLIVQDLFAAGRALTQEEFDMFTENIKVISPDAYNWVMRSEPDHWSNAFFGGARYNHMEANFGELFYSWVAGVNMLPITQMVDSLRGSMMEMIYMRRVGSSNWETRLTPYAEEKLQIETSKAQSLRAVLSHGSTFEVRGGATVDLVDIENWNCSCRIWQLSGLPCCHAIAVIELLGRSSYAYCLPYFTTDSYRLTYAESIYPVPYVEKLGMSELTAQTMVAVTPPNKRPPGRPKTKPSGSMDIIKRQLQCSKCKGIGHNKRRCEAVNSMLVQEENSMLVQEENDNLDPSTLMSLTT